MRPTSASASARVSPPFKREFEVLTLANLFQALVAHFLESALDRLSLRIQNALLQRNIYVSFHGGCLIIRQAASEAQRTSGLDQSGELRIQICQRALQDLAVARVLGSFELLEHMLARQQEALSSGVGWRFGRESAAAALDRMEKLPEPVVPRPTCSPILAPRRDYT